MAPPPETRFWKVAVLFESVQPISLFEQAPPPKPPLLFISVQLSSVPLNAPPPFCPAKFPVIKQLETIALEDSHQTPPPLPPRITSPPDADPFVMVSPI